MKKPFTVKELTLNELKELHKNELNNLFNGIGKRYAKARLEQIFYYLLSKINSVEN